MTQRQINSLNMFKTVLQFLNDDTANWNSNRLISSAVKTFSDTINVINRQAAAQVSNNKQAYTSKKDHDLETLLNLAYKLALRVKNYAVSINDVVLKQSVDFSMHDLEAGKETDIVLRCENIADKARSVSTLAPAEFKITADLIAQVTAALDAIEPDKAERDVISGTHTGATSQLNTLFSTAKAQLKTLDDLIEGDADDDSSEFVHNYFIMRRTVDRKGRSDAKKIDGGNGNDKSALAAKA